jgi:hypothetical protein
MRPTRLALAAALVLAPAFIAAQAPVLSKDFTIGCADCGGALQFSSFHTLELSPKGEILVADRDAPMLRLFDATGKPVWSGGTKGRGPGEYQYILRVAFRSDGGLEIADLSGMRVTTLGPDHKVANTIPLSVFPTTAGTDSRGGIVLGAETPSGSFRFSRLRTGAVVALPVPEPEKAEDGRAWKSSSIAASPSGGVAFVPHGDRYVIMRLDSVGARLPDITRAIERVRRTPAEEASLQARINGQMGQMRAAAEAATGKSSSKAPVAQGTVNLSLKPHFAVDGLRYDGAGRLWARTMRGDDANTIFDVFSPAGSFLGSVTMAGTIQHFAFAGKWMVTSGENSEGVPVVTRWTVR